MDNMIDSSQRTLKEKIVDKLLLLHLLNNHKIMYDTKLQKTIFFAEDTMNKKEIKTFSYRFIRWNFGEFSRELERDLNELKSNDLITNDLILKENAIEILRKAKDILDNNFEILRRVNIFGDYTKGKSLDEVKKVAYTEITRNGIPIKDIPLGELLLEKLEDSESKMKFVIEESEIGTFELMLDEKAKNSLLVAISQKIGKEFFV